MAWEVSISYFGVESPCDIVTKKYNYQEGFPTRDQSLLMPEEVCRLVRDQDQDGEFFDSIEEEDSLKRRSMKKVSKRKKILMKMKHLHWPSPLMKTSIIIFLLYIKRGTWQVIILLKTLMILYSMIVEMKKVARRISMKFLLQKA